MTIAVPPPPPSPETFLEPGLATALPIESVPVHAAGILFVTKDGQALFLQRSTTGDQPGSWCTPGGKIEDGETPEQAAVRECLEETGYECKGGPGAPHTRRIADGVDFTTFMQRIDEPFVPTLDEEHTAYTWAPVDSPPRPLHPGVEIALARLSMNEFDVAQAMANGQLSSPQRYENMALYALRITGTGIAYRSAHNEFVYRRPENYLTKAFTDRCNGLPVIVMHPEKATLTSKEYGARNVGSIMLAYVKGDEVWGIARIYDDRTAEMMSRAQLSTSPCVILEKHGNSRLTLEDGSTLLVEGKASLLDHLAICEQGVWDKGEGPKGIEAEIRKDSVMTEEEKKALEAAEAKRKEKEKADADEVEAKKKADAEVTNSIKAMADSVMKTCADMSKRMDSIEQRFGKKADADETAEEKEKRLKREEDRVAADKKRKDSEDDDKRKKEEKEKADAAKADSDKRAAENEELRKQVAELQQRVPKAMTDADFGQMAELRSRADSVYSALGKLSAPAPMHAETSTSYRIRLLKGIVEHSPAYKEVALDKIAAADVGALGPIEERIYSDAMSFAKSPSTVPNGELRVVERRSPSGHIVREFVGEPVSWMRRHAGMVSHAVTDVRPRA